MVTPEEFQAWLDRQLALLQLEREAEVTEACLLASNCSPAYLERSGLALLGLGVASLSTGLGGKTLIELERPAAYHVDSAFPPHSFRTGDLAKLVEHSSQAKGKGKASAKQKEEKGALDGVVFKVSETRIVLAVDRDGPDDDLDIPKRCRLVKLANDAVYIRMEKTLQQLQKQLQPSPTSPLVTPDPLVAALLGFSDPRIDTTPAEEPVWLDQTLNPSQREAARFVLHDALDVGLIHGPPGTGKTQTLCEVIRQLVQQGKRVLVCGASNLAVDNLVERLALHKVRITRLGHPARILQQLHHVTLDSQVTHSSAGQVVEDIKQEMNAIVTELGKGKLRGKDRKAKWNEHRELRKELRKREGTVVANVVSQVPVVLATTHGAGGRQLHGQTFDVVVIDEAAQALEATCWIPILKGRKLILAGDPLQLPPTVKSTAPKLAKSATSRGKLQPPTSLAVTLFERLLDAHGPALKRLLAIQYRMHERIMRFASDELYESKLVAADDVKGRVLRDLVPESDDELLLEPLVFYDTAGADMYERVDSEESLRADSKSNENEAELVLRHVKELVGLGIPPEAIAIISPYQAQVALLSLQLRPLYPTMQIGTVDGFQGREAEVVCVSLVRSNATRQVGFLSDSRRLNVAMTRPRRQLAVFGDSETVSQGTPYLKRWMAFLEEHADVRLAGML